MASASTVLRGKIGLVLPGFVRLGEALIEHPRVRDLYPEYLFTSHCVIRASVPLMATARDVARARPDDPVCTALAPYLHEHIEEERGHDEWLLEDLESIGFDRDALLRRPPTPAVAALVGAQYYWIQHYHPVALLGYIELLEGYPPSPEMVERLQERTGYPPTAFRTVLAHAELDPGHGAELDALLDSLPLTRTQTAVIGLSALHTVELYARAIDEIVGDVAEAA